MSSSSTLKLNHRTNPAGAALAILALGVLAVAAPPAEAANGLPPGLMDLRPDKAQPPVFTAEAIDREALVAEDEALVARTAGGAVPLRFAVAQQVSITPDAEGLWTDREDGWSLWQLEIDTPGALSQYARIENFNLPKGAEMWIYDADGAQVRGPFTAADKGRRGGFTSPIILGDRMVFEILAPADARDSRLIEVTEVYRGYRYFGEDDGTKRGSCNINVICPEGDPWRDQIRAVAFYVSSGSLCSGTLVNNTAEDDTPYFLTAGHCNVTADNAHAVTVYWNYETPTCDDFYGGDTSQFQTGATLVAAWGDVGAGSTDYGADMKLLQLDSEPDAAFNVHYAGWDVSSSMPQAVTGIHHPNGDQKSISFENDPLDLSSYIDYYGDDNWLRVNDWDLGTTEGGSSGSCIFDQSSGLCVGTLSGGYAACGNDDEDWYAWIHRQWEGNGTPETRLRDWLDPLNLGVTSLQGRDAGTVAPKPEVLWLIPAAASAPGDGTSNWLTQVNVANPSTSEVAATLYFVKAGDEWPGEQLPGDYTIPAGGSLYIDDVLASQRPATGLMYVIVDSTSAVVTTRTYNLADGGITFGQGIPGILLEQSKATTRLILPMVHSIPDRFRANLGLVQTSAGEFRVRATIHNQAGVEIASKPYRSSAAFTQVNDLFNNMNIASTQLEGGWIELELTLGSPAFWTGYVSIVDDGSDDGTYVMPVAAN